MSFLKKKKQRVRVFGEDGTAFCSRIAEVLNGVPQGTILGPMLFNIYIKNTPKNDIAYTLMTQNLLVPLTHSRM